MPTGIGNPVLGYLGFCAVKFAGYSVAARLISDSYGGTDRSCLVVGGVRTLIGMAVGAAYYAAWRFIPGGQEAASHGYVGGLVPFRIVEWWLLIWLFYDRPLQQIPKGWRTVGLATVWSFVLDVPALFGFFVTGGVWIC